MNVIFHSPEYFANLVQRDLVLFLSQPANPQVLAGVVPMLAAGAPALAIVVTTYVINMRHCLMAATLAPSFRTFPRGWLALVAHVINDESFAVAVARRNPPDPWVFIGSALAVSGAFLAGVSVGTPLGGLVADPARWGLDFAFPAVLFFHDLKQYAFFLVDAS